MRIDFRDPDIPFSPTPSPTTYLELIKAFCSELCTDNSVLQYLVFDCSVFIIQFVINTNDKLCHNCLITVS